MLWQPMSHNYTWWVLIKNFSIYLIDTHKESLEWLFKYLVEFDTFYKNKSNNNKKKLSTLKSLYLIRAIKVMLYVRLLSF